MGEIARTVRVTGRVQGVSFRVWTLREAQALGLSGWVRNEDDGSVAALLRGPAEAIDEMLHRLWQGPPGAQVRSVYAHDTDERPPPGFRITR